MKTKGFTEFTEFIVNLDLLEIVSFTIDDKIRLFYINKKFNKLSNITKAFECLKLLYPTGYISYKTALDYYNNDIPDNIYYCVEQTTNYNILKNKEELEQSKIDQAFLKNYKLPKKLASIFNYNIFIIHTKYTNKAGIIECNFKNSKIYLPEVERLLIDIIVRPELSGGIKDVINAYSNILLKYENVFNLKRLLEILNKLDYIYPYFQTIGYLLDRNLVNTLPFDAFKHKQYKFYLTKGSINQSDLLFDKKWNLFIPKEYM